MSTESLTASRYFPLPTPDDAVPATGATATPAARVAAFAYGLACYAAFLGTFLYGMGFITGFVTPTRLDAIAPVTTGTAWLVNVGLLAAFALQHSVMARPGFKKWWTRFVPEPVERSTYCLFSSVALIALFAFWQPMGGVIWDVSSTAGRTALIAIGLSGWLLVLVATFLINHFDLFGLRQVWLYLRGKPYTSLRFQTPGPYRLVRHPLYVGWLLAFWGAPTMTFAHLVFAVTCSLYILVAIRFEERDLVTSLGEDYRRYRRRVPMLVPFLRPRAAGEGAA